MATQQGNDVHFTTDDSPDDIEKSILENAVPVPDGYTHITTVTHQNGTQFIAVCGEGVPAMFWGWDEKGVRQWYPVIPRGKH